MTVYDVDNAFYAKAVSVIRIIGFWQVAIHFDRSCICIFCLDNKLVVADNCL